MRSILNIVSTAALLLVAAQSVVASKADNFLRRAKLLEKRSAGAKGPFKNPVLQKRAENAFLNSKTQPFAVNGTGFPGTNFDLGESYAGLLPISSSKNETRELFFWFFPTTNPRKESEIAIWLNGGPGCSSLSGLLQENGPFTWDAGTLAPTQNPYSWTNITNMVWVEQPIGVGYDTGKPNITNEYQLGQEFIGFYKNFVDLFGLYNWRTYLTGESYAGYYVPYIANAFILANNTRYYNLAGAAINDPIIGDETVQQQITVKPFVDYWSNLFYLNSTFTNQLDGIQKSCGYADYLNKYFKFPPPKGPFPVPADPFVTGNFACDIMDIASAGITEVNPCFNVYHITDTCPFKYDVLGIVNPGDYEPPGALNYFNQTSVKKALHAPLDSDWFQCAPNPVFAGDGNDHTLGPAQDGVLQRVIEHTNNVIIGSGNLDFLLNTNGTLFALQNVTWNGKQGFQQYPSQNKFIVPYHPEYNQGALAGSGIQGTWGHERGLTFYQIQLSGHELPGYAPGAGYRALELLLHRIPYLDSPGDFSTQTGNFGNGKREEPAAPQFRSRFNAVGA